MDELKQAIKDFCGVAYDVNNQEYITIYTGSEFDEVLEMVYKTAIDAVVKEPEQIRTSASYRQGYVRAVNDKVRAIKGLYDCYNG